MRASRVLLVALSAAALAQLAFAVARRIPYPYDLEWMEGGMLCHALRVVEGQPIYAEPSSRFVALPYTPLYALVVALLAPVFGLGYVPARAVSIVAFAGALVVAYRLVRGEGGSRAVAAGAAALPAAAFGPTGAWYDLVRVDSLFLALLAATVMTAWRRRGPAGGVAAAVLATAAFFTKQTALPFAAAVGLWLLLSDRRAAAAYAATLAVLGGGLLAWAQLSSGGWFWTYAFRLHQGAGFSPLDAMVFTPARLALLLAPGLVLLAWALRRARTPGLAYATGMAGAAVLVSGLGAGLEWSYHNALIPGVYFLALAAGVAAAALERSRPRAAALLLAAAIATAPGALVALTATMLPRDWRPRLALPLGYGVGDVLPTPADRLRGDALLKRLAETPGDVLVPAHSFYPHLVGKPTHLHAINLDDLGRAHLGVPRDLVQEMRARHFSLVVVDAEEPLLTGADGAAQAEAAVGNVPALSRCYRLAERVEGPRVFSGGRFQPCCLLVPYAEGDPAGAGCAGRRDRLRAAP
jgi:hypothetical protein